VINITIVSPLFFITNVIIPSNGGLNEVIDYFNQKMI
jgi:hypothetical protein